MRNSEVGKTMHVVRDDAHPLDWEQQESTRSFKKGTDNREVDRGRTRVPSESVAGIVRYDSQRERERAI
jgi:hypothetical protein